MGDFKVGDKVNTNNTDKCVNDVNIGKWVRWYSIDNNSKISVHINKIIECNGDGYYTLNDTYKTFLNINGDDINCRIHGVIKLADSPIDLVEDGDLVTYIYTYLDSYGGLKENTTTEVANKGYLSYLISVKSLKRLLRIIPYENLQWQRIDNV